MNFLWRNQHRRCLIISEDPAKLFSFHLIMAV